MAVACCLLLAVSLYRPLLQSWLCGKFIGHFDPAAVALNSSFGYEAPFSKSLMRWTVIAADILGKHFHCRLRQCSFQASTLLPKKRLILLLWQCPSLRHAHCCVCSVLSRLYTEHSHFC